MPSIGLFGSSQKGSFQKKALIVLAVVVVVGIILIIALLSTLFSINDRCTKLQLATWFFATDHSEPPKCAVKGLNEYLGSDGSSSQLASTSCDSDGLSGYLAGAKPFIEAGYIKEAADKYLGGEQARLIALLATESAGFDPNSYNAGSGAAGLGQFLSSTAMDGRFINHFQAGGGRVYPVSEAANHRPGPGEAFDITKHDARFEPQRMIMAVAHKLSLDLNDQRTLRAIAQNPDNEDFHFEQAYIEAYHTHNNSDPNTGQYKEALEGAARMMDYYHKLMVAGSCEDRIFISGPVVAASGSRKTYGENDIPKYPGRASVVELYFDSAFGDSLMAAIRDAKDRGIYITIYFGSEKTTQHSGTSNHYDGTAVDITASGSAGGCPQKRPHPGATTCNDIVAEIMNGRGLKNVMCSAKESGEYGFPDGDCNHFSLSGN